MSLPKDLFANVILSSVSPGAPQITTLHLRYPRFIHSEIMTHRVFSRNARSSRAVPVTRMIEEIRTNPVVPWHWTGHKPGMQGVAGHDEIVWVQKLLMPEDGYAYGHSSDWEGTIVEKTGMPPEDAWVLAAQRAAQAAEAFADAGYHKQVCNRLLEPFMWIDTLVTATEWDNFFELRIHPDAEPHIHDLAVLVKEAIDNCSPQWLEPGEWHMPYITDSERHGMSQEFLLDLSSVRNARISYAPFDGQDSQEKEKARVDLLKGSPLHASPFEHVAMADPQGHWTEHHRNFRGYAQYRGFLEDQMK